MTARKRVLSGMQPSGEFHLGNYLGALRRWVELQADYECFFCVVDYHAITGAHDPASLPRRIHEMVCCWLAAGIDPETSAVFVQSDVPEHTELAWVFASVAPMGMLERMTQYKEKAAAAESVHAGLFTYPVLQAADILLYKAQAVPVGDDQLQHLELTREIARRFNHQYGTDFPEPEPLLGTVPRVMGLDGKRKMSKSLRNHIGIAEPRDVVWEKLRTAVTDENRKRRSDPGDPDVCNIYTIHKGFTEADTVARLGQECRTAAIGCVDCKKVLFESMTTELDPVRERLEDWRGRPEEVRGILDAGGKRCRAIAAETMAEVRDRLGIGRREGG